eukprot:3872662-Prymnesium_polylepis.1
MGGGAAAALQRLFPGVAVEWSRVRWRACSPARGARGVAAGPAARVNGVCALSGRRVRAGARSLSRTQLDARVSHEHEPDQDKLDQDEDEADVAEGEGDVDDDRGERRDADRLVEQRERDDEREQVGRERVKP